MTILIGNLTFGQNTIFEGKMKEALQAFSKAKIPAEFVTVSYKFEQIASVETKSWLPFYNHAMCYIMASFLEKPEDGGKKDAHLEMALISIEKIKILAPEESEVYAIASLYYTAKLIINPMERAQKFSPLSHAAIAKSLALNPDNPRPKQLKISNDYGKAAFFGSNTDEICEAANALLNDWDNFKPKSEIHPNWGKNTLLETVNACSEKVEATTVEPIEKEITGGNMLTVEVKDLKSNKGIVLMQLMDEDQKVLQSLTGKIENNTTSIVVKGLEKGIYSIQYFHDENENMSMDTDQYGRPTEGYGYSNNAKGTMGPPKIKKTLFNLDQDLTMSLITRN